LPITRATHNLANTKHEQGGRFSGVDMPVQRDRCNKLPPNASIGPAAGPDDPSDNADNLEAVQTEEDGVYNELGWARVPQLERCGKEHLKGPSSWIFRYGWPVYDRFKKRNY
jgi:hypothetical protein